MSRCFDSTDTLSFMSAMIKLCLSTTPLLNGDSDAVTLTVKFINSAISINFELANSPPLSVKNFSCAPYICTYDLQIALRDDFWFFWFDKTWYWSSSFAVD